MNAVSFPPSRPRLLFTEADRPDLSRLHPHERQPLLDRVGAALPGREVADDDGAAAVVERAAGVSAPETRAGVWPAWDTFWSLLGVDEHAATAAAASSAM